MVQLYPLADVANTRKKAVNLQLTRPRGTGTG
jgi:hypothetical protein